MVHRLRIAANAAIPSLDFGGSYFDSSEKKFSTRVSYILVMISKVVSCDFREISAPIRYAFTDLVRRFPTTEIFHEFQEISAETYSTASETPPATIYLEIKEVEVGFLLFPFLTDLPSSSFQMSVFNRHLKPTFNRNAQVLSGESAGKEEEEDDLRLRVRRQRRFRRSKNRMINFR